MRYEKIALDVPNEADPVMLTAYLPDNSEEIDPDRKRRAVILCPGGGYRYLSDRESEPVAFQLLSAGFNVFILAYKDYTRVQFPQQQLELAAAIFHVRTYAERYHVHKDKIVVMGFSAGGHLCGSIGVMYNNSILTQPLNVRPEDIRPDGMVLCYPVVTGGEFISQGSIQRLMGTNDPTVLEKVSLEKLVHEDTPPTFLWATYEDEKVPVENSLLLAEALRRKHVSLEMHIFPHGPHGLSLNTSEVYGPNSQPQAGAQEVNIWIEFAKRWIAEL